MSEWKEVRLGEVCDTISDTIKKGEFDDVILINTSDVLMGKVLNHEVVPNKNLKGQFKKKFKENDILYSEIRPQNCRFAYIDFDPKAYIASTKLMVIRSRLSLISPAFLFSLLKSNTIIEELQSLAETRSGTFPQITFSELSNLKIKLPPLPTQKKIAKVLSSLDDKIELNNRMNENLEAQAQAVFKSWFVDFEPFGGVMPAEWREGILSELIDIKYGKDHKLLADGSIPVYGSGGLMRKAEKSLYNGESVLIPRKGTLNNVLYVNEEFWTVDTMFYSIMKHVNTAKYVHQMMIRKDLAAMNAGSAVPSMTAKLLNEMMAIIPDADTLKRYELAVGKMYLAIQSNQQENQKLTQLRDTLLPRLMSGEIDVDGVEV